MKSQILNSCKWRMASSSQGAAMRWFVLAAAAGLASTTVLGVVMAYRLSRRPALVTTLLIAGVVLPAALLLLAR